MRANTIKPVETVDSLSDAGELIEGSEAVEEALIKALRVESQFGEGLSPMLRDLLLSHLEARSDPRAGIAKLSAEIRAETDMETLAGLRERLSMIELFSPQVLLGPLSGIVNPRLCRFTDGFVTWAHIEAGDLVKHWERLSMYAPLKGLRVDVRTQDELEQITANQLVAELHTLELWLNRSLVVKWMRASENPEHTFPKLSELGRSTNVGELFVFLDGTDWRNMLSGVGARVETEVEGFRIVDTRDNHISRTVKARALVPVPVVGPEFAEAERRAVIERRFDAIFHKMQFDGVHGFEKEGGYYSEGTYIKAKTLRDKISEILNIDSYGAPKVEVSDVIYAALDRIPEDARPKRISQDLDSHCASISAALYGALKEEIIEGNYDICRYTHAEYRELHPFYAVPRKGPPQHLAQNATDLNFYRHSLHYLRPNI